MDPMLGGAIRLVASCIRYTQTEQEYIPATVDRAGFVWVVSFDNADVENSNEVH
jgi:hypothetical protein